MQRGRQRLVLIAVLLLALIVFVTGIQWGLPSRAVDPYLFGDHPVWSGEQILALMGERAKSNTRGADVDENPIVDRSQSVWLNETDQQRAAIVLRYRLYSYQPDEMNTLMALASMKPGAGDFDPKMYKYGGLWVYPVGAMLKLASICKLIVLKPNLAYYLDHPEAFGRFYIVARLYTVMWGVVGAWAIFWIAARLARGNIWIATAASLCFIFMPVVVTMAHEAKPHLPGAVLTLLAIIAATKFVERGRWRWAIFTGAICGAAVGMVLSAWVAFAVIPVMLFLRRRKMSPRITGFQPVPAIDGSTDVSRTKHGLEARDTSGALVGAGIVACVSGVVVYFITNPYVAIHLINNRELLKANLGNSAAFYHFSLAPAGIVNAIRLILEGTSPVLAIAGIAAIVTMALWKILDTIRIRRVGHPERTREGSGGVGEEARTFGAPQDDSRSVFCLMAVPAAIALTQFVAFAIDQPMDYARFGLLPLIALAVGTMCLFDRFLSADLWKNAARAIVVLTVIGAGVQYLHGFLRDCSQVTSRIATAVKVQRMATESSLLFFDVLAEPAPYSLPPVNLFHVQITLAPRHQCGDQYVLPTDDRISWADRNFDAKVGEAIY